MLPIGRKADVVAISFTLVSKLNSQYVQGLSEYLDWAARAIRMEQMELASVCLTSTPSKTSIVFESRLSV